jgi:hypothetical protein
VSDYRSGISAPNGINRTGFISNVSHILNGSVHNGELEPTGSVGAVAEPPKNAQGVLSAGISPYLGVSPQSQTTG